MNEFLSPDSDGSTQSPQEDRILRETKSVAGKNNRTVQGEKIQAVQGKKNKVQQTIINVENVNVLTSQDEAAQETLAPERIPTNIIRSGVIKFVGRDEVLEELHEKLQQNQRIAITTITGMGGLGKTELALQYAQIHWEIGTYAGGVCWFPARQADLGTKIVSFARTLLSLTIPEDLDLLESVEYCWHNWREGNVLIVLDDVVDYEEIKAYLPLPESKFKILITTRLLRLGESFQQLNLEVLTEAAALELLISFVGEARIEAELEKAKAIVAWLGYLPLGLELVGRYLQRKQDLDLEEMEKRLALEHDSLQHPSSDMTDSRGVMAAFNLSWQDLAENQQKLCLLLSLFAVAPIPWERVEQCLLKLESQQVSLIEKWFPTFLKLFKRGKSEKLSQTHWEDIRDEVVNCSLVKRQGKGLYQLHQLIKEFLLRKLEELGRADEYKRSFCQVMVAVAEEIPFTPTCQEIESVSSAIPHLAEAATTFIDWLEDEDLIWPFLGLSRFYQGQGAYEEAKPWLEQCLSLSQKRLGQSHLYVAASLVNLAALYRSQGRYKEAEPLFLQALEMFKRLLGQEHPDVAQSLNNFAGLYKSQGKYEEAAPLFLEALEMRKRLLGQEHPDVAQSLNNLAGLYESQGKYEEAEPLFLEALEMSKRLLKQEHPSVAAGLNNLAGLYESQGKYKEAEPLFLEALEMSKRLLEQEHPSAATHLNNLAGLYYSQGRYEEVESLYLEALEMSKRLLGQEHPNVATSLNNLANLYQSQGRYSEAEPLFLEVLEMRKRLLGQEHPDVATSLNNLAALYKSQGRYEKAEPLFLEALEMLKCLLGPSHPNVATNLNNLAELYQSQGRYSEAEPLLLEALEMRKRLLGQEHPDVASSIHNLAGLYQSKGRYSEAEPLFLEALEMFKRLLGQSHRDVAASLNGLALLYKSQERYSEAEPLYLEALEMLKCLLGQSHPDVATNLNNLAELYESQRKYSEAEPLFLKALEMRKRLLGQSHRDVAASLNGLALLYKSQGRYSEAKPLYQQALDIAERKLGTNHPNTLIFRRNLESIDQ